MSTTCTKCGADGTWMRPDGTWMRPDGTCRVCVSTRAIADPNFSGPVYDEQLDHERLSKQHERIRDLMIDGVWRTVAEIAGVTGYPENSIQAQLRHLRKPRFGGWIVEKQRRGTVTTVTSPSASQALWEYKIRKRTEEDPPYAGGQSSKNLKGKIGILVGLLEDACVSLDESGDLFARSRANVIRRKMEELGE